MHKIGDMFFAKDMMIEYKIFSSCHLDKIFNWKALVLQYGFQDELNNSPNTWVTSCLESSVKVQKLLQMGPASSG